MFIYFKGTGDNLLKGTLTKSRSKTMEKKRNFQWIKEICYPPTLMGGPQLYVAS